jgi:F-type H+-transporting ATPase subunit epsilon
MKFLLEIITPERKAFAQEVDFVSVPTPGGVYGVLARHMPLFTSIIEGEVKIVDGNQEYFLAIGGGFMQVMKEKVMILVSRAVNAEELNEEEIKKAEAEAKAIFARAEKDAERHEATAAIRRTMLEMKVLNHRKRNPRIN